MTLVNLVLPITGIHTHTHTHTHNTYIYTYGRQVKCI